MNIELFLETIHISIYGMLGVFIVIGIIYLSVKIMNYIFPSERN